MSDGDGVDILPCCSQCIHSACLSQFLVSARLIQLQQQSSSAENVCDCCPACKQPLALQRDAAIAVDLAVTATVNDAAAAVHAEMSAKSHREAEERARIKHQRRKELLDKFSAAQPCSVCVLADRFQSTKHFMHAFGNSPSLFPLMPSLLPPLRCI